MVVPRCADPVQGTRRVRRAPNGLGCFHFGGRSFGLLGCLLLALVPMLISCFLLQIIAFVPFQAALSERQQVTVRASDSETGEVSEAAQAQAEVEKAQAALAKAQAEAELAEAKAAVARAKAELAAAKTGEVRPSDANVPVNTVEAPGLAAEPLEDTSDGSLAQGPAEVAVASGTFLDGAPSIFRLPESVRLFNLLARFEETMILGNLTALDMLLEAGLAGLFQFAAVGKAAEAGELTDMSLEEVRDMEEVGKAINADTIATAIAPRFVEDKGEKGGDWRPLARELGALQRLPDIVERVTNWDQLMPDALERATGVSRDEVKAVALAFLRSPALKEAGSWTEAELDAAEEFVQRDEQLRRVFARMDKVRNGMKESFGQFTWVPLVLLIAVFGACYCLFCAGPEAANGPAQEGLRDLPLFKLER